MKLYITFVLAWGILLSLCSHTEMNLESRMKNQMKNHLEMTNNLQSHSESTNKMETKAMTNSQSEATFTNKVQSGTEAKTTLGMTSTAGSQTETKSNFKIKLTNKTSSTKTAKELKMETTVLNNSNETQSNFGPAELKQEVLGQVKATSSPVAAVNRTPRVGVVTPSKTVTPTPTEGDWLMISSASFKDPTLFPPILLNNNDKIQINVDNLFFRINSVYNDATVPPAQKPPTSRHFWFRISDDIIFYSNTNTDLNILGTFIVRYVNDAPKIKNLECFQIKDDHNRDWKLCTETIQMKFKWMCILKERIGQKVDPICSQIKNNPSLLDESKNVKVIEKIVTQPMIIFPQPSPVCNEGWDYSQHGNNWKCECEEGVEQSPVDLPSTSEAVVSEVKPLFKYYKIDPVSDTTTVEQQQTKGESIPIQLLQHSLRIFHHKLGKVITMDGAVYYAQEIVIHTPAEHKIDGKTYPMEIQVIHYGQSVGDIAKQLVLCFLFEVKPGAHNKFIESLNYYNLPNESNPKVALLDPIYIPNILLDDDDLMVEGMKSFSFYTYQGSIPFPPCTEQTIVYVASKPLHIGSVALDLFKEAQRKSTSETSEKSCADNSLNGDDNFEQEGYEGRNVYSPNNRSTQPLNGRPVFFYDHEKYLGPDPKPEAPIQPLGHYEKITKTVTEYFKVSGNEPSGMLGALVVTPTEAHGTPQ